MVNTSAGTVASIEVVDVRKGFGSAPVLHDVVLNVPRGAVVALLGPSGCGKTTLLRTIAGLERADAGEICIDGRVVAGPGRHVPPERRHVGMVFQDWALFPHLSVSQNVGYGLGRADRKGPRVAEVLAMVGLDGLGDRQPATLSGGQQQRVALARALAPRPGVLLLDEPFSNLDATLRVQVRSEVHQLLTELGVTTVFVTHDQEEAFLLGDEVAVVHGGRIVQQAPPAALYARPATPWVASFVGDANLVAGTGAGEHAVTDLGAVPLETPTSGAVRVLLRPEELRIEPLPRGAGGPPAVDGSSGAGGPPAVDAEAEPAEGAPAGEGAGGPSVAPGSPLGVPVTVELREYYGHDTVYVVRADGPTVPEIRIRAGSIPQFARGDRAWLRYAGPPALAFPGDGSPPSAAPGNASAMPAAGREQPIDDADAHGGRRAAHHDQPASGEPVDGGAPRSDDEHAATPGSGPPGSERFARHAPTR